MEIGGRKAPLSVEQRPSSLPTKFSPVRDLNRDSFVHFVDKTFEDTKVVVIQGVGHNQSVLSVIGGWFGGCTETFDKERQ